MNGNCTNCCPTLVISSIKIIICASNVSFCELLKVLCRNDLLKSILQDGIWKSLQWSGSVGGEEEFQELLESKPKRGLVQM